MKRFKIYSITLIRSVVSATAMLLMESDQQSNLFVAARIVKCWASSLADVDSVVPVSVTVVSSLWMFAGFALSQRRTNISEPLSTEESFLKLDLLLMLCTSLYDRAYYVGEVSDGLNEEEAAEDDKMRSVWSSTYDTFCLVCFNFLFNSAIAPTVPGEDVSDVYSPRPWLYSAMLEVSGEHRGQRGWR